MKTEIYFRNTLKEDKEDAHKEHGSKAVYQDVYKYSRGKGNNFYRFFVYE